MDDLFLAACRRRSVPRPPIWIMRQAGRYLPEYRAVRERVDFVTLCRTPDLAAEVTLQPIDRFGLDAAILFSDILVPADALGFEVAFNPGPVVDRPIRTEADVARVPVPEGGEIAPYVYRAVELLATSLSERSPRIPLIGFAAAPFTLAAYLVEGSGSKNFRHVKSLLYGSPRTAHALLDKIATITERYLREQIRAGARAVQLFDSWAGLLGAPEYRAFSLPYAARVLRALEDTGVPRIYFALDAAHLYGDIRECGADVVGVDWRTPLTDASKALGDAFVLQGNLDPVVLLTSPEVVRERAAEIVARGRELPGHIFNLGHGILPETPIDHVRTLVDTIRSA